MLSVFSKTRSPIINSLTLLLIFSLFLTACGGGDEDSSTSAEDADTPAIAIEDVFSASDAGLCANPYFPVVEGATWTYQGTDEFSGTYTFTSSRINVRPDGFTYSNEFTDLTQEQEWACTSEGLIALQFDRGAAGSVSMTESELRLETSDVEGITLPHEISAGDTWEQSFAVSGEQTIPGGILATSSGTVSVNSEALGEESVTVAAGEFNAMKIHIEFVIDMQMTMEDIVIPLLFESESTVWYALGVGWVKSEDRAEIDGVESLSSVELQSYFIP